MAFFEWEERHPPSPWQKRITGHPAQGEKRSSGAVGPVEASRSLRVRHILFPLDGCAGATIEAGSLRPLAHRLSRFHAGLYTTLRRAQHIVVGQSSSPANAASAGGSGGHDKTGRDKNRVCDLYALFVYVVWRNPFQVLVQSTMLTRCGFKPVGLPAKEATWQ